METSLAQHIMVLIKAECPICKEQFRCKGNLRKHLKREHTDIEAEWYLADAFNRL